MEFQAENQEQLKYLLGESSEIEREAVEERMFADGDFFADLLELENDLSDAFVSGRLLEVDRQRYEKSLARFPERRENLLNAWALHEFIRLETNSSVTETVGFFEKIRAFFSTGSFATRAMFAALLLMLTIGTGFLLYDRYRLSQQLANLKNDQNVEQQQRENELEKQLEEIREREKTLQARLSNSQTELDDSQTQTVELREKIESEQAQRQRLERELENLRRKRENQTPNSPKNNAAPPPPLFAGIFLSPVSGGKGTDDIKYLEIGKDVSNIRLTLQIPPENTARKFSVDLNGLKVISNVSLRGGKTVVVSISANKFKFGGENRITLNSADGESFDYLLIVERRK